jgi:protein tyrosine/serine phosphatase
MSSFRFPILVTLACVTLAAAAPRERPATWATPVIGSTLANCFRVSDELYRCEQPSSKDVADLKALGIRSVLNLREYHSDSRQLETAGLELLVYRIDTGEINIDDLAAALRLFREAPKPLMVHCWHGSDRTGSVVAAYRIVYQNWTPAEALDELRNGGFGYHERWFPNIVELFETIDADELRRRVLE